MNIADLKRDEPDAMVETVTFIYGRKPPEYAVYSTADRVKVMFADNEEIAKKQRRDTAPLNPLRGQINGLLDDWRKPYRVGARIRRALSRGPAEALPPIRHEDETRRQRQAARYDRRVGDALILALEDDVPAATVLLQAIRQEILDERIAWARFQYLIYAAAIGVIGIALLLWGVCAIDDRTVGVPTLWDDARDGFDALHAAQAGAIGAFFSIALAIKNRTVLTDLNWLSNAMDASLRMLIGMISGGVLMVLVDAGLVRITLGELTADSVRGPVWLFIFIVGFVAGFLERLVPDLLAKAGAADDKDAGRRATAEAMALSAVGRTERKDPPGDTPPPSGPPSGPDDDPAPEEAASDHCACDVELSDDEVTADADLPPASGGVASVPSS